MIEELVAFGAAALACQGCDGAENWYLAKSRWCRRHAKAAGVAPPSALAGYAVLSTNATVAETDRNYQRWLAGGPVAHFGHVKARLELAMDGDLDGALSYKEGMKIRSFADNLLRPKAHGVVTIDRHAARILTQDCGPCARALLARKGGYAAASDAYLSVAESNGMIGSALQARTWVHQVSCLRAKPTRCERHAEKGKGQ